MCIRDRGYAVRKIDYLWMTEDALRQDYARYESAEQLDSLSLIHISEKTDGNEADRTAEGFAKMFGSYFPPEFSITEGNAWMSTLNNRCV